MELNRKKIEQGQALLFVVVAVTIAMAVGISVSTRTLDLSKRVSRSDTASRVIAAAEGGIETLLTQPDQFLDTMADANPACGYIGGELYQGEGGGKCIISFPSAPGDKIVATAIVDAEIFKLNAADNYWFNLTPGYVKEIILLGYTDNKIEICWDNKDAAIYFFSYNYVGDMKKGGFISESFPYKSKTAGFTQKTATREGYVACGNIDLVSNPFGLRLKTFFAASKVYVFPTGGASGSFPNQGYKLISKGQLQVESDITDSKTVDVYRSFPYSPSIFDYALYTGDVLR
jgi:hypothetical protein